MPLSGGYRTNRATRRKSYTPKNLNRKGASGSVVPTLGKTKFGLLRTNDLNSTDRATAVAGGATDAMLETSWGTLQANGAGTALVSSAATSLSNTFNALKSAGCAVTLGPGMHFEPAWLSALPAYSTDTLRFKNSAGDFGDDPDTVFSAQMWDYDRDYLTRLNGVTPLSDYDCIRIGTPSSFAGELLYTQSPSTDYWVAGTAPQTGSGLVSGQVPTPFPGYYGSSTALSAADRRTWVEWVMKSLANTANRQMDFYDSMGFTGQYLILMPGSGYTPAQFASDINTTLPRSSVLARGAAWYKLAEYFTTTSTRPPSRIVLWCSSFAQNANANQIPQASDIAAPLSEADSTTFAGFGAARRIKRIADERGFSWGGENPGRSDMDTVMYDNTAADGLLDVMFRIARVAGKYNGVETSKAARIQFAHANNMFAGPGPAFSNYSARIAAANA